jgi:ABC-2 type transport system permease protein
VNAYTALVRYCRLYGYCVRFSISKSLEFRFDFFFRVVMDLIYYAVNICFYLIIFRQTSLLGGWTEDRALVFVATYCIVDALQMTFYSNNGWMFPTLVNKGDLDYYLVRPVNALFMVSFREFALNSFINLVCALGLLVWTLSRVEQPWSMGGFALYVLFTLNGALLYYLLNFLCVLPVFWMQSSRGIDQVFYSMTRFMERPHTIFKGSLGLVLKTILPFSLMASVPSSFLFEPFSFELIGSLVVVTLLMFLLVVKVWSAGLRSYSSASS